MLPLFILLTIKKLSFIKGYVNHLTLQNTYLQVVLMILLYLLY